MLSSRPHLSVEDWLRKLDLSSYSSLLRKFNGVEDMLDLSERELKDLGIHIGSHRARLVTSLTVLRKKYETAYSKGTSPNTSSTSLQVGSPNSKSFGSCSPIPRLQSEVSSGVRSWPSSGSSSLAHTRHSSHRSSMEYGLGTEASPEDLKRALKQELSLDSSDLRSFAWYHGTILRQRAEELLKKDGDFLVRDCISQPGDFVITCRWQCLPLHFIIKKVILQPNTTYERISYSFENDSFGNISDFVTHYVGSRCPLSANSGAVISNPINRTMPLTYYASRYGVHCQIHYAAKALAKIPSSPILVEETQSLPTLPEKSPSADEEKVLLTPTPPQNQPVVQRRNLIRVGSDPSMNPNITKKTLDTRPNSGTISTEAAKEIALQIAGDKPPPKPSRVPSKRCSHKPLIIKRDRRNTPPTPLAVFSENIENSVGTPQLRYFRRGWSIPYKRTNSGETRFSFLDRPSVSDDGSDTDTLNPVFTIPLLHPPSCFKPIDFHSSFISNPNKPVEGPVLSEVMQMLLNETKKKLACHLMRADLEVAKNFEDEDLGVGVTSGLELILLPQGQQLVNDLIERSHCMKLFVAVTLLTCSSEERVEVLHKWIDIATETKNGCGNFYGFTGIMLGLTMPQILHLDDTWHSLRCLHTESAVTFETKLVPALKTMQEASNKVPPNTCIPYIMSLLSVLQNQILAENMQSSNNVENEATNFGIASKANDSVFGLQVLENHLEFGRSILQQLPVFQSNVEITLKNVKYDNKLLDIFRTEFHLRLLWGSQGAVFPTKERHEKYQKVLDCLYTRCQQ